MTGRNLSHQPFGGRGPQERALQTLFMPGAVVVVATREMSAGSLAASERTGTERMVESRLREYTLGRVCARDALSKLGMPVSGIPRGPDRLPQWPPGVVGSISHCDGLCVAVVAHRVDCGAIGIDAEPAIPLDHELHDSVCRPAEWDHLQGLPCLPGIDWPKVVFSVKESFYKAWFPVTGKSLDFTDVELTVDPVEKRVEFSVLLDDDHAAWGGLARGRFEILEGYLVTGVTMLARPS
jgi:4'-phosphopantetheinyl transferase EntD